MEKQVTSIEIPYEILMECMEFMLKGKFSAMLQKVDSYTGLVTFTVTHDKNNVVHDKALTKVQDIVQTFADLMPERYSRFPESI